MRERVVDVGRDLGAAAAEGEADRPHAGQAAAGLAQAGGDRAGDLDVAAVELDVEGGQRRAGGDQGRAGGRVRRGGPKSGRSSPLSIRSAELGEAAVAEEGALAALGGGGQLAVEEDRHAEGADPLGDGAARRSRGRVAVGRVEPDERADVEGADRRVQALVGGHVDRLDRGRGAREERLDAGARRRSPGEGEDGAVVVGVGVAVEQRGRRATKAPRAARCGRRRAPRRRWGRRAAVGARSDEQLAVADERLAVDLDRRLEDDAVEVDRDLDRAADRRRGAEGDVGGAEDLLVLEDVAGQDRLFVGADPELGDVGAVLAVGGEQLEQRLALGARSRRSGGRRGRSASPVLDPADPGDRAVDDERPLAGPLERRDEPLAAGQVAEGAAGAEVAGVDDRGPALEAEPQVAAVGAGDPRLGAAVEDRRRSPRRGAAARPCRRSSPGRASPR